MTSQTLFNAQHTLTMQSSKVTLLQFMVYSSFGKTAVAFKIWKRWHIDPITRSTCILTLASFRVALTSPGSSWSNPRMKAGIQYHIGLHSQLRSTPCLPILHHLVTDGTSTHCSQRYTKCMKPLNVYLQSKCHCLPFLLRTREKKELISNKIANFWKPFKFEWTCPTCESICEICSNETFIWK